MKCFARAVSKLLPRRAQNSVKYEVMNLFALRDKFSQALASIKLEIYSYQQKVHIFGLATVIGSLLHCYVFFSGSDRRYLKDTQTIVIFGKLNAKGYYGYPGKEEKLPKVSLALCWTWDASRRL